MIKTAISILILCLFSTIVFGNESNYTCADLAYDIKHDTLKRKSKTGLLTIETNLSGMKFFVFKHTPYHDAEKYYKQLNAKGDEHAYIHSTDFYKEQDAIAQDLDAAFEYKAKQFGSLSKYISSLCNGSKDKADFPIIAFFYTAISLANEKEDAK